MLYPQCYQKIFFDTDNAHYNAKMKTFALKYALHNALYPTSIQFLRYIYNILIRNVYINIQLEMY